MPVEGHVEAVAEQRLDVVGEPDRALLTGSEQGAEGEVSERVLETVEIVLETRPVEGEGQGHRRRARQRAHGRRSGPGRRDVPTEAPRRDLDLRRTPVEADHTGSALEVLEARLQGPGIRAAGSVPGRLLSPQALRPRLPRGVHPDPARPSGPVPPRGEP